MTRAVHDGLERRRAGRGRASASRIRATTARSRGGWRVYVRERKVVSLEFAIRSMTSLPATVFGMTDRGVIRPGAFADLVIFDPAAVRDTATYADPQKLAEGVSDVLVNGVPVLLDGKFTDASPGRVLRK